jgi:hypothetical protein
MRHVEKNDLDMCEQIVNGAATRDEIESMPVATGIVFGFTPKPVVVKFDTRQSRDLSETPGIERLRQPMGSDVKTTLLPETMGDLPMRPEAVAQPETMHPSRTSRHESEDERKIKKALQYRKDGYGSVRKLEGISGWSNGECRRIIRLMKERGLIEEGVM